MAFLLPIASGKGGVGKTVIAANLGLALARSGRTVVAVDLDLGASNLHTCLGVKNKQPGLGAFVWKTERKLVDLVSETAYERLWFIAGDGLLPGTANLEWFAKRRILRGLGELPADFVILDLGAGSSYNVVDFFLASGEGMVVVRPEITSILNAYSFLKTATFRLLFRSFSEKSPGRSAVLDFARAKTEGRGMSYLDLARELADRFPEEGSSALDRLAGLRPCAVMNQGGSGTDGELGYRLRDIAKKNLGLDIEFAGYLPDDPALPRSVALRTPLVALDPTSPFAREIGAIAARVGTSPRRAGPELHEGGESAPSADTLESLIDGASG
ncbi:MAG: P-loop NTPase [Rectinemataceae bacterium]